MPLDEPLSFGDMAEVVHRDVYSFTREIADGRVRLFRAALWSTPDKTWLIPTTG
jgi:hypothetical protein